MRPSIEAKVDELIDDMLKLGAPVDLAEHFSLPIAFKVIYEILGIPYQACKLVVVWWCCVCDVLNVRTLAVSRRLVGIEV